MPFNISTSPLYSTLAHAVTRYDRAEQAKAARSKRGYYNPYALGIYLGRCEEVAENVESHGMDKRAAITSAFNDRLRDHVLIACGLREIA